MPAQITRYSVTLTILFCAIMFGHITFCALVYFLISSNTIKEIYSNPAFLYIVIALCIFAMAASFLLFSNKIQKIKEESDVPKKLYDYRIVFIMRIAILEAACMANIIFFLLTTDMLFLYLYLAMAVVMLSFFPSKSKIMSETDITDESVL